MSVTKCIGYSNADYVYVNLSGITAKFRCNNLITDLQDMIHVNVSISSWSIFVPTVTSLALIVRYLLVSNWRSKKNFGTLQYC